MSPADNLLEISKFIFKVHIEKKGFHLLLSLLSFSLSPFLPSTSFLGTLYLPLPTKEVGMAHECYIVVPVAGGSV